MLKQGLKVARLLLVFQCLDHIALWFLTK